MNITYGTLLEIIQRNLDYWGNDRKSLQESLTRAILWELKRTNERSLKEVLGKAVDRAEQKMQTENVKPRLNCGPENTIGVVPPKRDTFTFSSGRDYDITNDSKLRKCAKALVDKLNLIEKDGRCANIFVFAANHGCIYSGPNYEKELKDLKDILNENI